MASPVGERDGQVKRPRCVGLIFLPAAALALTAMLVAGCGGGGDPRPKVEAGLRHYFSTFSPEDSVFPYGAGPPRVKDNGCKDLHRTFPLLPLGSTKFPLLPLGSTKFKKGEKKVALWQCFVRFKNFTLTVHVAVNDSTEVVWALPVYGDSRKAPKLSPARTYTG
jgi:hypothetical protein